MENGNGGGAAGVNQTISCDDVISKLKDDGDFDRLRLKIIRKLKENEELRNSIVSIVKQSVALNRPGSENMKPRQLSDAIHQEVGGKVNEQISNGLWEIIRSPDDFKTEISETVKSVYSKLATPKRMRIENTHQVNGTFEIAQKEQQQQQQQQKEIQILHQVKQALEKNEKDSSPPPGFPSGDEEDLDAPPGFS